ncbi:MAG: V-type ATP synthase subunit A [Chlamydiia bacterium]
MKRQAPVWQSATGTVEAVNGNLVSILFEGPAISGEKIYVEVDDIQIKGEIIEIANRIAKAQMFEDTKGIRLGSKAIFSGELIEAELGPGLLNLVIDGIGSPLALVAEKAGYFMERGIEIPTLDRGRNWEFIPTAKMGDILERGMEIGFVVEGRVRHKIMVPFKLQGKFTLTWIAKTGHFTVETLIAKITNESAVEIPVTMIQKWPIKNRLIAGHPRAKDRLLETGMRAIDTMFPIVMGSTTCSPGPFGAGKTVIQHLISKYANVDIVIIVACGERAGEVVEVITEFPHLVDPRHHEPLMNRTSIICNTSSMPVAARESSIYMGITIAEYYRQMGLNVLLLADSTSRWAQAMREVSARLEEIPGEEAFPAYLSSRIHSFYERAGVIETPNHQVGSISVIGAVSPAGGNFDEPVTQATLMVVDTFLCLSRELSDQRRYPAISRADSWSTNLAVTSEFLNKQAPEWKESVEMAQRILLEGLEIEKRMDVVGEDAIQMSDYITYLKKELFDFAYLQQNAFDQEDVYCPIDRQIEIMELYNRIFGSPFLFKNHDAARKAFVGLQNDLKNLNYTAFRSDSYSDGKMKIENRIDEMLDVCK